METETKQGDQEAMETEEKSSDSNNSESEQDEELSGDESDKDEQKEAEAAALEKRVSCNDCNATSTFALFVWQTRRYYYVIS